MVIISFLISVIVFVIDQVTKVLIYGTKTRSIIGNLLWFESTLNTGVAFSMFKDSSNVFIVISTIASIILSILIANKNIVKKNNERVCLGFMLGGTVANLVDRIIFGGVRDFIYLKFINFAIFNIADMAISFGAGFLCCFIIYYEVKDYLESKKAKQYMEVSQNDENNIDGEAKTEDKIENN